MKTMWTQRIYDAEGGRRMASSAVTVRVGSIGTARGSLGGLVRRGVGGGDRGGDR